MKIAHTFSPEQKLHRFVVENHQHQIDQNRLELFFDALDEIGVLFYYPTATGTDIRIVGDSDEVITVILQFSDIIDRRENCGICTLHHIDLNNFKSVKALNNKAREIFEESLFEVINEEISKSKIDKLKIDTL